jgi:hypothetical protein
MRMKDNGQLVGCRLQEICRRRGLRISRMSALHFSRAPAGILLSDTLIYRRVERPKPSLSHLFPRRMNEAPRGRFALNKRIAPVLR